MKSGYSFSELADMHLVVGKCSGNLLMLLEDTEKNTVTTEFQIVVLYFLLTAGSERWKYSMECDGMLVVHIVHVMHGWKSRSLKLLKESLPSVLDGSYLVQVSIMLLYTVQYKNSTCIPTKQTNSMAFSPQVNYTKWSDHWSVNFSANFCG
jgi:hypothetical protein